MTNVWWLCACVWWKRKQALIEASGLNSFSLQFSICSTWIEQRVLKNLLWGWHFCFVSQNYPLKWATTITYFKTVTHYTAMNPHHQFSMFQCPDPHLSSWRQEPVDENTHQGPNNSSEWVLNNSPSSPTSPCSAWARPFSTTLPRIAHTNVHH